MRMRYGLVAIGCWLCPAVATAMSDSTAVQNVSGIDGPPARPSSLGRWWIGVWGGAALHSEFDTRWGRRHRDLYMAGVRVGRQLSASRLLAVDYYVEVVPLIRSTNNPVEYRDIWTCVPPNPCTVDAVMETATARGYGVTPIGLQMRAFPRNRVQVVLGLSLGVARYDRPVPDPDEKRFNFMGDLVLGTEIPLGRSSALLAGVRQNHTSNANTGPANPGLDSRVLYVGATRSFGRRSQP